MLTGGDEATDPPALVVRGGAGGTRASIEALRAAATRADHAAAHLHDAARAARRGHAAALGATRDPDVTVAALAGLATDLLGPLGGLGPGGIGRWAHHAEDLAAGLRGSAAAYAAADDDAAGLLRAVLVGGGHALGEAGPVAWVATAVGVVLVGDALMRGGLLLRGMRQVPGPMGPLLTAATGPVVQARDDGWGLAARLVEGGGTVPENLGLPHGDTVELLVPGLAAWAIGAAPGRWSVGDDPVAAFAASVAILAGVVARLSGTDRAGLLVAPLVGRTTPAGAGGLAGPTGGRGSRASSPTGVADVLAEVAAVGDEPGPVVGIDRLDHADGGTSWVVAVPGTRSMALGGPDPMDNLTNLAVVGGRPDAMSTAVEEAMLRAGIGPDEPVVLAGHSQGGLVATRVAARLEGTFTVAAVVTAGSPVGSVAAPRDVPMLHVEHAQDWVPALDGRRNPDTPLRTTVVATLPAAGGAGRGLGPAEVGAAHEAWAYVGTAAAVDLDESRSVGAFRGALADALGDGTATVTRQRYAVVRVPE